MIRDARILLIEDDVAIATVIRVAIEGEGACLDVVTTIAARNTALESNLYDLIITDVMLPDGNGLSGLSNLSNQGNPLPPVVVLSAQNTLDTAVRAAEEGAFDYLPKPFDLDDLIDALSSARRRRVPHSDAVLAESDDNPVIDSELPIIGRAAAMQHVYRTIARVAPTDLSVLILGESGTGKELVAQAIHNSSRRRDEPFIAINMAAIPRELIESELFGHEKGAFTGASTRTSGRFEQAKGGTLFLDEIGDMPYEAQTRLLRVLQTGDYSPVGSARILSADVRIIAATNQDLSAAVAAGRFREDLFYRLNVIPIELPPLRERSTDVALLADHFLVQAADLGLERKRLSAGATELLSAYHWPGNVRELGNVMQRLALLSRGQQIARDDVARILGDALPEVSNPPADSADSLTAAVQIYLASAEAQDARSQGHLYDAVITKVEQAVIETVLLETGGNQLRAAAMLGINRNTLRIKRNQT